MHVLNGVGMVTGLLRKDVRPGRARRQESAAEAGPGDYDERYDDAITDAAVAWIKGRAESMAASPGGALFVSRARPHFPADRAQEWYNSYPRTGCRCRCSMARTNGRGTRSWIPCGIFQNYHEGFDSERKVRRAIAADSA